MGGSPMSHRQAADATIEALGGSRFLKTCFGLKQGPVPRLDLKFEISVQNAVRDLIREGLIQSAHDCSEGGLAVALAECCFNPKGSLGAEVTLGQLSNSPNKGDKLETFVSLFGEAQSRILISVAPENADKLMVILRERNVPHLQLGTVIAKDLRIVLNRTTYSWPIADLHDDWWNSIRRAVEQDESIPSL